MSALWAPQPSEDREAPVRPRSLLRPVALPRERMSRVPFVLVLIGLFGLGMAGLLMLNTTLQNQAFEAQSLNRQATSLTYDEAALQRQVDDVRAPQEVARRASQLGMRANPYPAFINVTDGEVTGYPEKVKGNEEPSQILKTPEQLAAEAQAAEERRAAAEAAKKQAAIEAAKKKAAADAQKKADAAAQAKLDAQAKVVAQAEAKANAEAEAKAKTKAEAKSKAAAEAKKKQSNGRN